MRPFRRDAPVPAAMRPIRGDAPVLLTMRVVTTRGVRRRGASPDEAALPRDHADSCHGA